LLVRWLSTKSVTSSRVIRAPPPVPTIIAAVSPCSRSRRRTAGVMRASALPGSSWVPRSSEPAGPCVVGVLEDIAEADSAWVAPSVAPSALAGGCFVSGSRVSSGAAAAAGVGSALSLAVAVG
jgi:hypothetical protein